MNEQIIQIKATEQEIKEIRECLEKANHSNSQKLYGYLTAIFKRGDFLI